MNSLPAFQQIIDVTKPGATLPINVVRDGMHFELSVATRRNCPRSPTATTKMSLPKLCSESII